jgi:hypothetical protein
MSVVRDTSSTAMVVFKENRLAKAEAEIEKIKKKRIELTEKKRI